MPDNREFRRETTYGMVQAHKPPGYYPSQLTLWRDRNGTWHEKRSGGCAKEVRDDA